MEVNASLTIRVDGVEGAATLELRDYDSAAVFVTAKITAANLLAALGRLCDVKLESCELLDYEKVGKELESKVFEFVMPSVDATNRVAVAQEEVARICPEGWETEVSFSDQDSFFYEAGRLHAKCILSRWVPKGESDEHS